MNSAEIKIDLFRRLDKLENSRLEKVYNKIIVLLNTDVSNEKANLTSEMKVAIDEALDASEQGRVYSHNEAMTRTKEKYPNLFK